MIDIESEIFNDLASKVRESYPNAFVTGEYVRAPSTFPCVAISEISNVVYERTSTNEQAENHAQVTYQIDVYSDKKTGKKSECKAIIRLIDDEMNHLGFIRTALTPVANLEDATIYRMIARYRAVISREKLIYRR